MDNITQRDILKKWIVVVAHKYSVSVYDICTQIKKWIPNWKSFDLSDEDKFDYNINHIDMLAMTHEIINADGVIDLSTRQHTGSYYTPIKWAEYMVRRTLNVWICDIFNISYENKLYPLENGLLNTLSHFDLNRLLDVIIDAKIIDIACGTGVFLILTICEIEKILEILCEKLLDVNIIDVYVKNDDANKEYTNKEYVSKDELSKEYIQNNKKSIILNIVEGWDINADALALYSLWIINRYGLNGINKYTPVKCIDSLSDKCLDLNNKYDIVIGNPPYLGEKGNKALFDKIKSMAIGKKYYYGKMDLSYFFVIRALELIKENGLITYIMTNYFVTADGAKIFREHIKNNADFIEIFNLNTASIFEGAKGQHNIIYTLKKISSKSFNKGIRNKGNIINKKDDKCQCDNLNKKDDKYQGKNFNKNDYTGQKVLIKNFMSEQKNGDKNNEIERINIHEIKNIHHRNKINNNIYDNNLDSSVNSYYLTNNELYRENGNIILYKYPEHKPILDEYESICDCTWGDIFDIKQGIVSGADRLSKRMMDKFLGVEYSRKNNLLENMPIFVFNNEEIQRYKIERIYLKPFYKNSDVGRYTIKNKSNIKFNIKFNIESDKNDIFSQKNLLTQNNISNKNMLWIAYTNGASENDLKQYSPNLFSHLKKFIPILSVRREVKNGSRAWYELQWHRNNDVFDTEKIVVPHRNRYNKFAFVDFPMYGSADIYYFKFKDKKYEGKLDNWYYHLAIANSSIMYMWLYNYGKKKGEILELYGNSLRGVKIPKYTKQDWQKEIVKILFDNLHEKLSENKDNKFSESMYENLITQDVSTNLKINDKCNKNSDYDEIKLRKSIDKCIFDRLGFDENKRKIVSNFLN